MLQEYIQPPVEVFNIRVDEPITTLTDILLTCICLYAGLRICRRERSGRISKFFTGFFLTLGVGSLSGGLLGHAFLYAISPYWKLVSWILIMVSVAIMVQALVELARPLIHPVYHYLVTALNLIALSAAIYYTSRTLTFSAVEYYSVFALVLMAGSLSSIIYRKTGNRGVVRLMVGVGVGIISVVIFSLKWGLSPWLNHNDISHLILSVSVLILFNGAVRVIRTCANPD